MEIPILRLDEEHWSAAVTIADHMFIAKLDVRVLHAWQILMDNTFNEGEYVIRNWFEVLIVVVPVADGFDGHLRLGSPPDCFWFNVPPFRIGKRITVKNK